MGFREWGGWIIVKSNNWRGIFVFQLDCGAVQSRPHSYFLKITTRIFWLHYGQLITQDYTHDDQQPDIQTDMWRYLSIATFIGLRT